MRAWMVASILLLALTAGCTEDSSTELNTEPDPSYPLALEPDLLIDNLVQAFTEMNATRYEELLHPDFTFWFDPAAEGPLVWSRFAEVEASARLLGGWPGLYIDERGEQSEIAPVATVDLAIERQTEWSPPADTRAAMTTAGLRAYHWVTMTLRLTDGLVVQAGGLHRLHVRSVEVEESDEPVYVLLTWQDSGASMRVVTSPLRSWSEVKLWY
jgi:hypothetical protein